MTAFTVESVVSQEEWSGNRGQMITYELMLAGEGSTVQLIRQAKSEAPSAGDTLDGTIEHGSRGPKLKLNYDGPPSSNGGGSSKGGDDFERRPDHPVQMQRALHTSCLSVAPAVIDGLLSRPGATQPQGAEDYFLLLAETVERLKAGYPKAVLDQAAKADG